LAVRPKSGGLAESMMSEGRAISMNGNCLAIDLKGSGWRTIAVDNAPQERRTQHAM
jgi:hypothetical protein